MWFADIYCDTDWISERKGVLGPKRFRLHGAKSLSLGIEIEFHLFGDDQSVRHMRALMYTDDQRAAETCVDLNIQTWVASLEVTIMMETGRPFHVARFPSPQMFAIVLGQGNEDSPAAVIDVAVPASSNINYERIAFGVAAWNGDIGHHLFYFRRLVDSSLPLDVRWLNGYRLLEWHFVGDRAGLSKIPKWREFLARFDDLLKPFVRPNQTTIGLMEEARALAAHAGIDDRLESERKRDPRNAMEKTFRAMEQMVLTVLNEHPSRACSPVQFQPRGQAE
jgi:hypothetical protein